jgi:ABC-type iron transport system FetAB permease component
MKSAKIATIISTLAVILLVVNHALMNRVVKEAGGPNDLGVSLPRPVTILIKLDHFVQYYFYVMIPFLWVATVLIVVAFRAWFDVSRAGSTGEQP